MAVTHFLLEFLALLHYLFKRLSKLVWTRSRLVATFYALDATYHILRLKTLYQSAYALEISVTSAHKFHTFDNSVLDLDFYLPRTCAASLVAMLHNYNFDKWSANIATSALTVNSILGNEVAEVGFFVDFCISLHYIPN